MLNKLKKFSISKAETKKIVSSVGIATAATVISTAAIAANSLTPITADYSLKVDNKYNGTATRSLTKSGNSWSYKVDAKASGIASGKQRSSFVLSGNSVIPSSASTTYKVFGVGRTHSMKFSNSGKNVVSTYAGKTSNLSSSNRAYDDLSLEAQIRQDLLSGHFTGNYYMVKKDKIEKTPFKKAGSATITVPAGTFNTIRVNRVHDDNSRSTSFWLAPSLDYLPVKVIQNNGGKRMEMKLTKVR